MNAIDPGTPVNIINEQAKVETGFVMDNPKPDRDGLVTLKQGDASIRVHPKRVVSADVTEVKVEEATPARAVPAAPKQPKVLPQKIDLGDIAKHGELWTRRVDFDGKTDTKAHTLIFPIQGRYLSFNTYDDTFGKKGKQPPVQDVLDGKEAAGTYAIKDIDKLRGDLARRGYTKYGE